MRLYGCWFHFCQGLRRHANAIPGFVANIRVNPATLELYAKFLCLPLLPDHMIGDAFNLLNAECESYDAVLFRRFLKYFNKQWIIQVWQLNNDCSLIKFNLFHRKDLSKYLFTVNRREPQTLWRRIMDSLENNCPPVVISFASHGNC